MNKYTTVEDYLEDLTDEKREQVEALRKIIASSNSRLTELIKWNSPSYSYQGVDCITFNLHREKVSILVHMGVSKKEDKKRPPIFEDTSGLLEWNSNIRATMTFDDLDDISSKERDITKILKKWLTFL